MWIGCRAEVGPQSVLTVRGLSATSLWQSRDRVDPRLSQEVYLMSGESRTQTVLAVEAS